MLTFTNAARDRILGFLDDFGGEGALRITLLGNSSPLAPRFELELVESDDRREDDVVLEAPGFHVLLDAASAARLDGASVDFSGGAFELAIVGGKAAAGDLVERVSQVIEHRINPAVAAHGGRITLVAVEDDIAYVRMSGGCQGCGLAAVTLRQGVERMLREAVPEILAVRDVTDHADGSHPFYART